MRRFFAIILLSCPYFFCQAQVKIKNKKYPSLLWEISGNGLKKSSFLFGTMHVSSKIAFHLSDSFYLGIKNADVVALETNPESWQEDLTRYEFADNSYAYGGALGLNSFPADFLTAMSLKLPKYEKQLEQALYSNPSTINNLLYRSYDYASDFEEDTYLDMYIYQVGKKWGKKVAGVERYDESMKLMMEAYRDAAKDKNKRERSFDPDEGLTPDKLQEAYRTGNLDLLDSINKMNSFSEAFDEKFLYRRNDIQAASIDSILRNGHALFAGVGAAHLPGTRGVIEILRKYGYRLRPVMMGERDSKHKDLVEKIRVPVKFQSYTSEDAFYKADIPGTFYRFEDYYGSFNQVQYADMANGSYYIVTRVKTYSALWGHSPELVAKKIDSVLYENVPGKILNKQAITRNGYKGFDIMNRTRRGDYQRYNIFVTPYEILFFKMSGNAEYVKNGDEAGKFFTSIQLKEFKPEIDWKNFQPSTGGFSVDLPHEPFSGFDGNWFYEAQDKSGGNTFTILRTDIHNYGFAGEDTFDLALMEESFAGSEFIDTLVTKNQGVFKGYPALDCRYKHTNGSVIRVRYLIQGPHYYTLVAQAHAENPAMERFFDSFSIAPFNYGKAISWTDTSLYYTVKTPVYPKSKKEMIQIPQGYRYGYGEDDESESGIAALDDGVYRNNVISNDTTGEKIYVAFYTTPKYLYLEDSLELERETEKSIFRDDTTWYVRSVSKKELPGNLKVWEHVVGDSNSSRTIRSKLFYRNGMGFLLFSQGDTLSKPSAFIEGFFNSFTPADTIKGTNPFVKKNNLYFDDLFSDDSLRRKKAAKNVGEVELEDEDLPRLKKAISLFSWQDKKYLDTKKEFIRKLGDLQSKDASLYLKEIYYAAGDTVELQYAALQGLLEQKTHYSFSVFKDIMTVEPPVLIDMDNNHYNVYVEGFGRRGNDYAGGNFLNGLYDSLQLTGAIIADLLPLLNLDDYKWPMMNVLGTLVDSNLVAAKDYEMYFSKFLIEAKQELKKQAINEKNKAIEKAQAADEINYNEYNNQDLDNGNDDLSLYATLLLPFRNKNQNVEPLIRRLLQSADKRLKYNTMILLLQNSEKVPDTLINYFASMDEYRYTLYSELDEIDQQKKFPAAYNNHISLAKSQLVSLKVYDKPDSIVFIDRLPVEIKKRKGFVYFFKYKDKKDDLSWQLASVGLVPENPAEFEFEEPVTKGLRFYLGGSLGSLNIYNFTELSDARLKDDEPVQQQLSKQLKKMLYSKKKSGRRFYMEGNGYDYAVDIIRK